MGITFAKSNQDFNEIFKQPKINKRWDNKKNKFTLTNDIYLSLNEKFKQGKGRSKHKDKQAGVYKKFIYSGQTFESYKQQGKKFSKYVRKNFKDVKSISDVNTIHVNEYLNFLIKENYSPWTIALSKAAIAKALDREYTDFITTPPRKREYVTRSRYKVNMDKHISEKKEKRLSKITSATGLRRDELIKITGQDLKYNPNIGYYLNVTKGTKGGRPRFALIMANNKQEEKELIELFKNAGKLKVLPYIPKTYDNHHYRAVYAKRVYNKFAKDIKDLSKDEKYRMRGDMKGHVLDKIAMAITSEALGHSRISVIAKSYLY